MAKNKNYDFCAYHSFGNSQSCITAVKWDAYDVKNTAGINGKTTPSGPQISSRFQPAVNPLTEIAVGKTKASGTESAHPLISTHGKFYREFRGKQGEITETGLI